MEKSGDGSLRLGLRLRLPLGCEDLLHDGGRLDLDDGAPLIPFRYFRNLRPLTATPLNATSVSLRTPLRGTPRYALCSDYLEAVFFPPLRSAGTGGSSGSDAIFRYSSRTYSLTRRTASFAAGSSPLPAAPAAPSTEERSSS